MMRRYFKNLDECRGIGGGVPWNAHAIRSRVSQPS
jgi:hypothetical protein